MKRKFKLITTIASLTAAIALLVAGVYAATVREVGINGSVTFTALAVDATVTVEEGYDVDNLTQKGEIVFVSGGNQMGEIIDELGLPLGDVMEEGEEGFEEVARYFYVYVVTITNDGAKDMYVKLTVNNDETLPTDGSVTRTQTVKEDGKDPASLTSGEEFIVATERDLVLTVSYEINAQKVTGQTFSWDFSSVVNLSTVSTTPAE